MKHDFETWAKMWCEYKKPFVKKSTYAMYTFIIGKHLVPFFNNHSAITENLVQQFVDKEMNTGHHPKTVKGMVTVLRMIAVYASKKQNIMPPIVWELHYTSQQVQSNDRDNVLSASEYKKLVKHVTKNLSFLNLGILLALTTGMRIGEICALQWQDIDTSGGVVNVYKTLERIYVVEGGVKYSQVIVDSAKTPKSIRQIPLPRKMIEIITPLAHDACPEYYVIANSAHPIEPRSFRNHFNRIIDKLKLKNITFHGLRHSFATRCIESMCDYKTLSAILGHSSVSITMNVYVHPGNAQKKKCIENMLGRIVPDL